MLNNESSHRREPVAEVNGYEYVNTSTISAKGKAALEYAERGWKVFPCKANGKVPITPNGQNSATDDPVQIRDWWAKNPNTNIGLFLKPSGLVAVDVDSYKSNCEWPSFIAGLDMPDTLTQTSARGGTHYLFRDDGRAFKGKLCNGVDVKHNGYIMLAPSTFDGKAYEWFNDDEPALAPDWLPHEGVIADNVISFADATKATPDEIDWAIARLNEKANDLPRDEWVKLCNAIKGVCGEAARQAFLDFSYRWSDTESGDPERVWDSAKPSGQLSFGSIVHYLGGNDAPKPPIGDEMGYTEDALALALGKHSFDRDARYVAAWGAWLGWDGTRWRKDETRQCYTAVRAFLRHKAQDYLEWGQVNCEGKQAYDAVKREAVQMRSSGKVAAIERLAQSNPKSAASHDAFDNDLMLLGTPGGTVDLETGLLREAQRGDMITKHAAVAPAPAGAVPHQWLKFLDRVFDGDQELINFMQRLAGYALTGKTTEHKLFFLHGGGANGKSVFLNTLMDLYGDYSRRAPVEALLAARGERHSTDIAGLHGARLVVGSELPKGRSWNEAVIKDLTGGDTMTARFMRQDNFDFDPQLSLLIAGNTKPSFGAVDEAIKRRVVLIPFEVTIPVAERDHDLARKLLDEGPAILRWAIDGAQEWSMFGLGVPASIEAASADYMSGEDVIGQFMEDVVVIETGAFALNNDLYGAYTSWCLFEDIEPMGKNNFLKAIEERGHKNRRTNTGRGKQGLRLK